jgi:hypothetical protein
MSNQPKILYIEDQLAQNIPRLLRLFDKYLGRAERKRLQELEQSSEGYGATPEEIQQIFKNIQCIDVEYRFPEALAKIRTYGEQYALFIVDRNLAEVEYNIAEVQKIEPQYAQKLYERFHEREGDYILLKLAVNKKVDILTKFYFLTAYSAQHEIRSSSELENLIDLGAFQQKNFIEKGNESDLQRLQNAIQNIQLKSSLTSDLYVFDLRDGSTLRGTFVSSVINIQTGNGKTSLNTSQIINVTIRDKMSNPEYSFALKGGDSLQGRFLDKKIVVNSQIDPKYTIITQNIQAIKVI